MQLLDVPQAVQQTSWGKAAKSTQADIASNRVDLGQERALVDGLKVRHPEYDSGYHVMAKCQHLLSVTGILLIATIGIVAAQGTLPTQAPASTAKAATKSNVRADGENSMTKPSRHRRSVDKRVQNGDYVCGKVHYRLKSAK